MNRLNILLKELKRRSVFRVAMVYAVVGWLLMQLSTQLEGSLNLPPWFDTFVTVITLIGFPIALILAWAFELTADGVKPTPKLSENDEGDAQSAGTLNYILMGALALAMGVIVWQNFAPGQRIQADSVATETVEITQSIAVLPFDDFSADKDQDYFANGISEELLNVLSRINGLRVSSRTSAFSLKDQGKSIAEIGQALDVSYVLEGSVRKSGQTLRITAQLIKAETDQHLWAETYDRALTAENIFAVQDEISAAIVRELKGRLVLNIETLPVRTASLEAYDLYFRAREQVRTRHPDALRAAVEDYQEVIAIDPGFAPAYSGLADAYLLMDTYADMDAEDAAQLAAPIIDKALALEPTSAEALSSASLLALTRQDVEKAIDYAEKAIAANPNHAEAYLRLGGALQRKLQSEAALEAFQKGRALDPLSAVLLHNIVNVQSDLGQLDAARATAEENIRWNPSEPFGYLGLAELLTISTDYAEAHSVLKDAEALNPDADVTRDLLSDLYLLTGMTDEATAIVSDPGKKATILAFTGRQAAALDLISDNTAPFDAIGVYYYLRDFETVLARLNSVEPTQTGPLNELVPGLINWYAIVTFFYSEGDHPDTPARVAKLDDYFGTRTPDDFESEDDFLAGTVYNILKNNPDEAYIWVDGLIDRGIVHKILDEPPFDGLRDTPEFKLRDQRMEEIRSTHRDAIQAQLVNPKPNWVRSR